MKLRIQAAWPTIAAALGAALLAGCVSQAPKVVASGVPSAATTTDPREMRTESDRSDADRRARVRLELASAYFGRGQTETALDELKQAMAAKPDFPEAYNLRGLIYASLNNPRLAEESFQRAIQLDPRNADALHNYGWFLCQQGQFDAANKNFDAALGSPQYRDSARTLLAQGVCLARGGKLEEAERSLMRAFELEPANPTVAVNLSEVLYRRKDYERARFYIRRVNNAPDLSSAQTLWLAARIENKMGNTSGTQEFGRQLRIRFPASRESKAFEARRFDE